MLSEGKRLPVSINAMWLSDTSTNSANFACDNPSFEDFSLDTFINRVKLAVPEMLEINNLPNIANGIMKQAGIKYRF